jgi:hypothetical protein
MSDKFETDIPKSKPLPPLPAAPAVELPKKKRQAPPDKKLPADIW